jgi:multiple PDZ domain protein
MFSSNLELSNAQQNLEIIKQAVIDSGDAALQVDTMDDLNNLLYLLGDPIFRDLIKIQDVIVELNGQLQQHPSILPADFDIVPTTGELILNVSRNSYEPEYDEQRGEIFLDLF